MSLQTMPDLPGHFVVVEGPDGSGKSTACRNAVERLRLEGHDVVLTRNVGGTPTAEALRTIMLDPALPLDPVQQTLVSACARRANLNDVVLPALERGALVVCDRFVASNLVFQTLHAEGGRRIDDADVVLAHRLYCYGAVPDLTLHVHAPADVRMARRRARGEGFDRFDSGDAAYDLAIADKYARAGDILGHPTVDIDGSSHAEEVAERFLKHLRPLADRRTLSIMYYDPSSRRWLPDRREGRIWWTTEPHFAHREASDAIRRGDGTEQRRIVERATAHLYAQGATTDQLDAVRRRF